MRGMVTWEQEDGTEYTTVCTSSYHKIVKRERGAYQYLSDKFVVVHDTSVPMTDEEALEYFSVVQVWLADVPVVYITARELDGNDKFKMLPYKRDPETGKVVSLVTTQPSQES